VSFLIEILEESNLVCIALVRMTTLQVDQQADVMQKIILICGEQQSRLRVT
jgi:hypothetical protein